MPSALSDPSSSRNWWSLPKHSNQPDVQEKASRSLGINLNSIASAIGLKPKKRHPSLAIQDPPPALLASPSSPTLTTPILTTRPTLSKVDSTGPPTPVDYQHDDSRSLLTLSDTDPFAGRPQVIPPVPPIPSEKTPLSVDTSVTHRISFASSSSLETSHAFDPSALLPTAGLTESRKLSNKSSAGSTDPLIRHTSLSPSPSSKRSNSSSTVVPGSQTHSTLPRPRLRARGMTDGGGTQKAGFFSEDRPASKKSSPIPSTSALSPAIPPMESTSPRGAIRQPSLSRLFAPPCAPPIHSLPATPNSPTKVSSPMQKSERFARQSISSSPISFVSSSSAEMFPTPSYPFRGQRSSERSVFSQDHDPEISSSPAKRESKTAPSSPRLLKKTHSHQSLTGKSTVHPLTPPKLPPPKLPPDNIMDKVFRKQRSFHHVRSSMVPPVHDPVGQTNSPTSPLTDFGSKAATERGTSGNYSLSGKRLLSHSSSTRPSTSPTSATTEDDSQSIFSLRSGRGSHLVPFKSWASPKAAPQPSCWDEAGSPVPSSPALSTSDYMPQFILSAAEVAKLEASIENSSNRSTRSRAFSLLSVSTTTSDREDLDFTPAGLSPPPAARLRSKQGSMTRKSSAVKTLARSPPRHSPPPNSENPENDSRSTIMYQPLSFESPALFATHLPPPPRSRRRSQLVSHPEHPGTASSNSSSVVKPSRSRSTVEKNTHRRSIMRKPSFLEIDDDTDQDIDLFSGEAMTESFLDLANESFEANQ